MFEAKITSKGQITIPIEIRRLLNISNGDKITFKVNEHGIIMDKSKRPLTIEERFESYDFDQSNKEIKEAMKEFDTGEDIGEEEV